MSIAQVSGLDLEIPIGFVQRPQGRVQKRRSFILGLARNAFGFGCVAPIVFLDQQLQIILPTLRPDTPIHRLRLGRLPGLTDARFVRGGWWFPHDVIWERMLVSQAVIETAMRLLRWVR